MFLKNCIVISVAAITATTILFTSCKKNDDLGSAPATPDGQITAAVDYSNVSAFSINSNDGHVIGINGDNTASNPKGSQNQVTSCGSANSLLVQAVCSNGNAYLYNGWVSGGGSVIALYINGQPYRDPVTGYGLWVSSVNSLSVKISGGIAVGQTYRDFVRTYCSSDTTNSAYYDTPITSYVVPSTFLCATVVSSGGGGKRNHRK